MPQPGWYPDPADASRVRYFDGNGWTENTQPAMPTTPAETFNAPPVTPSSPSESFNTAPASEPAPFTPPGPAPFTPTPGEPPPSFNTPQAPPAFGANPYQQSPTDPPPSYGSPTPSFGQQSFDSPPATSAPSYDSPGFGPPPGSVPPPDSPSFGPPPGFPGANPQPGFSQGPSPAYHSAPFGAPKKPFPTTVVVAVVAVVVIAVGAIFALPLVRGLFGGDSLAAACEENSDKIIEAGTRLQDSLGSLSTGDLDTAAAMLDALVEFSDASNAVAKAAGASPAFMEEREAAADAVRALLDDIDNGTVTSFSDFQSRFGTLADDLEASPEFQDETDELAKKFSEEPACEEIATSLDSF